MNELIKMLSGNKTALQSLVNLLSKRFVVWCIAFYMLLQVSTNTTSESVASTAIWGAVVVSGVYILIEGAVLISQAISIGKNIKNTE